MSTCRTCGELFEQSGRGRPRLDCQKCRPAGSAPTRRDVLRHPSAGVLGTFERPSLHAFRPDPLADDECALCGRRPAVHVTGGDAA